MTSISLSKTIADDYLPWLAQIDAIIGRAARVQLGFTYSWLRAWHIEELTPHEAVADAIARLEAKVEDRIWFLTEDEDGNAFLRKGTAWFWVSLIGERIGPFGSKAEAKADAFSHAWLK